MAFETLSLGLTLTLPTSGTRNWGTVMKNTTWTKISGHNHTGGGNGSQLAAGALQDNAVTQAKLAKNRGDYRYSTTLGPVGTTQTVDLNNGQVQKLDLGGASGDVTLTLSNPIDGGRYCIFIQQAAAPLDVIWPANVKWPGGQKPILSQDDNAVDKVELFYDGTNYFGDWDLNYS